jgi:hypothetical protein
MLKPSVVAHSYNPSTGDREWRPEAHEFKDSLDFIARVISKKKKKHILSVLT